jgi:hypothetical protein
MDDELGAREERHSGTGTVELDGVVAVVRELTSRLHRELAGFHPAELVSLASSIEDLSRLVDHLQVTTAAAMDRSRIATGVSDSWKTPEGDVQQEYKNTADYLRHRLRISRREAWRRIRLGSALSPTVSLTGQQIEPELSVLAESAAQGLLSGQAAQTVSMAMKRVQGCGTPEERAAMESALTEVGMSQDLDALNVVASAWINHVDPDGTAPSEQQKAELQGLFVRRKYRGLHRLDIFATEDQFESLMTALTPEASPRTGPGSCGVDSAPDGSCVDLEGKERAVPADPRSHAQKASMALLPPAALPWQQANCP